MEELADPELQNEFLEALKADAARGALRVVEFLRRAFVVAGISWDGLQSQVVMPAEFLLGLDCALRLRTWELLGLGNVGLPTAEHVLDLVMRSCRGPELATYVHLLRQRLEGIYFDHFVWRFDAEVKADLVLVVDDDEALLDALADFLSEHCHSLKLENQS